MIGELRKELKENTNDRNLVDLFNAGEAFLNSRKKKLNFNLQLLSRQDLTEEIYAPIMTDFYLKYHAGTDDLVADNEDYIQIIDYVGNCLTNLELSNEEIVVEVVGQDNYYTYKSQDLTNISSKVKFIIALGILASTPLDFEWNKLKTKYNSYLQGESKCTLLNLTNLNKYLLGEVTDL